MKTSLFKMGPPAPLSKDILGAGTAVLAGFALDAEEKLLSSLKDVIEQWPFRNMVRPGGFSMSVAMSNCGSLGWVTDRTGYRYDEIDPEVNRPWPTMPTAFQELAVTAAEEANRFSSFAFYSGVKRETKLPECGYTIIEGSIAKFSERIW